MDKPEVETHIFRVAGQDHAVQVVYSGDRLMINVDKSKVDVHVVEDSDKGFIIDVVKHTGFTTRSLGDRGFKG
jgi:hypothetical protein